MNPACTLVVGAGLAGSRCAETLRAEGYSGRIVVVGEEPHPPYERPALSKELLAGTRTELELRPRSFWDEREIELRLGTRVLDLGLRGRTAETSGGRIRWDALVLATGARARPLLALPDRPGIHSLRTRADADRLRRRLAPGARLAVVGAGFVGTEVASTAAALGVHVTLLEAGPAPFERLLGREVGLLLADRYRAHGVEVRVDAGVERFRTGLGGRPNVLQLSDGADIACDIALVAVGSEPAGDLLGPAAVPTDALGRTNLPGVHACGDVAAWWRPSLDDTSGVSTGQAPPRREQPSPAPSSDAASRSTSPATSGPTSSASACSTSAATSPGQRSRSTVHPTPSRPATSAPTAASSPLSSPTGPEHAAPLRREIATARGPRDRSRTTVGV